AAEKGGQAGSILYPSLLSPLQYPYPPCWRHAVPGTARSRSRRVPAKTHSSSHPSQAHAAATRPPRPPAESKSPWPSQAALLPPALSLSLSLSRQQREACVLATGIGDTYFDRRLFFLPLSFLRVSSSHVSSPPLSIRGTGWLVIVPPRVPPSPIPRFSFLSRVSVVGRTPE
ncbi:unnamed protein product, partial [Ectocarpus fasciculatus]